MNIIRWLQTKLFQFFALFSSNTEQSNATKKRPSRQYEPREIWFCTMPVEEEDLRWIPSGHEKRPYLVVKVGEDGFWGYPMSTSHKKYPFDKKMFCKNLYGSNGVVKDSYILFFPSVYIPEDHVLYFDSKLPKQWEHAIDRRILCQKHQHFYQQYFTFHSNPGFEVGDLVKNKTGQLCFFYKKLSGGKNEVFLMCHKRTTDLSIMISFRKHHFWIDPSDPKFYEENEIFLFSIMQKNEVNEIIGSIQKVIKKITKSLLIKEINEENIIPEKISFLYEPGTVFEDINSKETYIYFFSYKEFHYFLPDSWYENDRFSLYESKLLFNSPVASVSDYEMKTMLARLKSVHGKYYLALKKVEKEYWEKYSFSSLQKEKGMEERSPASLKPKINMKIVHESFGEGVIQKIDGDHVLVLFGNDTKTLNWKFLVDHHKSVSYTHLTLPTIA